MTRKAIPLKLLVPADSDVTHAEFDLTVIPDVAVIRLYKGSTELRQMHLAAAVDPLASLKAAGMDVSELDASIRQTVLGGMSDPVDLTDANLEEAFEQLDLEEEKSTADPTEGSALFGSTDPPPTNPFDQP